MTDLSQANSFGDWAAIAIQQHYEKIYKHEKKVLQDKDPEELHQMRVGMRRLRTAMVGFQRAIRLPKGVNEKKVGRIAHVLGQLRDNDVLQMTLNEGYRPHLSLAEQEHLDKVIAILIQRRPKALRATRRILTHISYLNFKNSLETWLAEPQLTSLADYPMTMILPDLLMPQLSQFLLHPGWLVGGDATDLNIGRLGAEDEATLHDLRKEAKRTRYQMELFTQFYNEDYQVLIERVKSLQDILGSLQDSCVLRQIVAGAFRDNPELIMPGFEDCLLSHRHQQWRDWLPIQAYFINPEHRAQCRDLLLRPVQS